MKNLRLISIFLFLFLHNQSHAQTADKWSLERCIDYALKNNLQVRQAELTTQIYAKDNLQSKLNVLPNISAGASFNNNFGNGFNPQTFSFAQGNSQVLQTQLQGSVPLFTGLQQIHNMERAKYELIASRFDFESAKNNVALSVASSYLQILLNQEIERIAEKQKELTETQQKMVQSRVKAGLLPENSLFDIESQLGRDEVNIVNARNALDISVLTLQQLLQLKAESGFEIESPQLDAENMGDISALSSKSVFETAVRTQPQVKSAEARVKSANASRKAAIGTLSPTLSLFGNLSTAYFSQDRKIVGYDSITIGTIKFPSTPIYEKTTYNEQFQNNFRKAVGISLDFPIFNRGQRILNIQKAKLQQQISQLQLDNTRNQLRQDIEQAYANARAAAESYMANKKSLEASQRAYSAAENRFKVGAVSQLDLQQARNNLLAAESEMARAKYTYVFRLKILDFYQGKPITLN